MASRLSRPNGVYSAVPCAQGAPDEPLDLLRAPSGAAPFAIHARVGRARQHAVLRGHPALALSLEELRHLLLDGRRADDLGVAEFDEDRALGVAKVVASDLDGAQLIRGPAVRADGHRRGSLLPGRVCTVRTRWS